MSDLGFFPTWGQKIHIELPCWLRQPTGGITAFSPKVKNVLFLSYIFFELTFRKDRGPLNFEVELNFNSFTKTKKKCNLMIYERVVNFTTAST